MAEDYSATTDAPRDTESSTPLLIIALAVGIAVFVTLTYLEDQSLLVKMLFGIPLAYSLEKWTIALTRWVRAAALSIRSKIE